MSRFDPDELPGSQPGLSEGSPDRCVGVVWWRREEAPGTPSRPLGKSFL